MLAGQVMQSNLINLSEIINNDVSCENKLHRHRKPYGGNFFAVVNPPQDGIYDDIADCRRRFPWLDSYISCGTYSQCFNGTESAPYLEPKIWKQPPNDVKMINSLVRFKKKNQKVETSKLPLQNLQSFHSKSRFCLGKYFNLIILFNFNFIIFFLIFIRQFFVGC